MKMMMNAYLICALNYDEIMKKEFENIFKKIKHEDKRFFITEKGLGKF